MRLVRRSYSDEATVGNTETVSSESQQSSGVIPYEYSYVYYEYRIPYRTCATVRARYQYSYSYEYLIFVMLHYAKPYPIP